MASYIREQTRNGEDLADKVLHILRYPRGKGVQAQRLQVECIQWLADRGFGKATLNVEHTGTIQHAWDVFKDISTDDLKTLVQAGRALNEANANVIEGQAHIMESPTDADE